MAPYLTARLGRRAGMTLNHSSGLISSLFVAADIANDVGDILVAFFLVGDEGRIIVVIVFDGLVDFDVVFRFGNDGLDLASVLLGIGLFQRDQFLGLGGFRRVGGCGRRSSRGARRGIATGGPGRCDRRNRHDLAGIGRDHGTLVQVIEFLTRRWANVFGSEI